MTPIRNPLTYPLEVWYVAWFGIAIGRFGIVDDYGDFVATRALFADGNTWRLTAKHLPEVY